MDTEEVLALRLSPLRRGLLAVALSTITIGAGGVPTAGAQDIASGAPTASIGKVAVDRKRLNVRAGRKAVVAGRVRPRGAGVVVSLQIHRGGHWVTLDRDRTSTSGRYLLRARRTTPGSAKARVHARGAGDRAKRRLGRMNVFRYALASWYGPGLYGRRTGCGGTLGAGRLGVAHKTLPCGAKVTLRHHRRMVRVRVIDRGPYVGAREFDLTAVTARRLRFHGHGSIQTTR